tara:strand:+ start:4875 stop:5303 length:429 start_codon:yes stop_codon:yes gene_type:complete
MMKPPISAVIIFGILSNKYLRPRPNDIKPEAAPMVKTIMSDQFALFKPFKIPSYEPKSIRIKEPLIPGKIIAHIATNPERNTYHNVSSGLANGKKVITEPMHIPMKLYGSHLLQCTLLISLEKIKGRLARISPKKKLQTISL